MMTPDHARAARELLAFYAEAGVDALLGEEPVDRLSAEGTASIGSHRVNGEQLFVPSDRPTN